MLDAMSDSSTKPVLWVAVGRQRVGKTALLSTAAQFLRARGVELDVWNGDQQNQLHGVSRFFEDASEAPVGAIGRGKRWIEQRVEEQIRTRRSAVLDTGGGFTGFGALVEDVPLVDALSSEGIRVVGLFVVGPDEADLAYLEAFAASRQFMPSASIVVLNEALVVGLEPFEDAFATLLAHPTIHAARARGAEAVRFPALACMSAIAEQGLSFEAVLRGEVRAGHEPFGFFNRLRLRHWWEKEIPAFFAEFPPAWLPGPLKYPLITTAAEPG